MSDIMAGLQAGWGAFTDIFKMGWGIFAQKKTWEREDTAIQRRVADLKAAGLNPVLAAGSAAQTSSPVSFGALQGDAFQQAAQVAKLRQDISVSKSQDDYLKEQAKGVSLDNRLKELLLNGRVEQQQIDLEISRQTQEQEIQKVVLETERLATQVDLEQFRAAVAKMYEAQDASLDLALKQIDLKVARATNLPKAEAELASLVIAAKAAKYNFDYYGGKGMPQQSASMFAQGYATLAEILGRLAGLIFPPKK